MRPRLNLKTYTVRRTAAPTLVQGRRVPGATSEITIRANVQPAGKKLMALPEARRSEDVRRIFTSSRLYVSGTEFDSDRLVIGGEEFEVWQVDEWPGHYECFASRVVSP